MSTFKPRYIDGVTMGGNVTGDWLYIPNHQNIGFQAVWTGTPVGTFAIDITEDGPDETSKQRLIPVTLLGATALTLPSGWTASFPAGTASSFKMSLNQLDDRWVRLRYVRTSGTGTLRVGFSAKGLS